MQERRLVGILTFPTSGASSMQPLTFELKHGANLRSIELVGSQTRTISTKGSGAYRADKRAAQLLKNIELQMNIKGKGYIHNFRVDSGKDHDLISGLLSGAQQLDTLEAIDDAEMNHSYKHFLEMDFYPKDRDLVGPGYLPQQGLIVPNILLEVTSQARAEIYGTDVTTETFDEHTVSVYAHEIFGDVRAAGKRRYMKKLLKRHDYTWTAVEVDASFKFKGVGENLLCIIMILENDGLLQSLNIGDIKVERNGALERTISFAALQDENRLTYIPNESAVRAGIAVLNFDPTRKATNLVPLGTPAISELELKITLNNPTGTTGRLRTYVMTQPNRARRR